MSGDADVWEKSLFFEWFCSKASGDVSTPNECSITTDPPTILTILFCPT